MSKKVETPMEALVEKWSSADPTLNTIKDKGRKEATVQLLENQDKALNEDPNVTPQIANYDPVLIKMVRRITPQLIHFDVMGVQPMTMPTGLTFALKARYPDSSSPINYAAGDEALFNKADTAHSGTGTHNTTQNPFDSATDVLANTGVGMATSVGETAKWKKMGVSIEKVAVEAKTRQLRADFSLELEKDLQAVHGLDAANLLGDILSQEIILEQNQEAIRTLYHIARVAPQFNLTTAGTVDFQADTDGRWLGERALAFYTWIERFANHMFLANRRGKGNFIITSSDVATMLTFAKLLKNDTNFDSAVDVNLVNSTYAGTLSNKFKVYVDPLLEHNGVLIGYKGANEMDAGTFFCPYVPLTMHQGVDVTNDFKKALGFQTRYAKAENPLVENAGQFQRGNNPYYYKFKVAGL